MTERTADAKRKLMEQLQDGLDITNGDGSSHDGEGIAEAVKELIDARLHDLHVVIKATE